MDTVCAYICVCTVDTHTLLFLYFYAHYWLAGFGANGFGFLFQSDYCACRK